MAWNVEAPDFYVLAHLAAAQVFETGNSARVAECERQLRDAPDDRGAAFRLGYELTRASVELDRAAALFHRAEAQHGPHWYAALELGVIAELRGELRDAASEYHRSESLAGMSGGTDQDAKLARENSLRVKAEIAALETVSTAEHRVAVEGFALGAVLLAAVAICGFIVRRGPR